ncbi:hypothetical protein QQ054_23015 [Oscillatoria amoena NRMC-F 0135]|nr:hypothetical protein [Oscillatoria amoena NRMC-F 0135]
MNFRKAVFTVVLLEILLAALAFFHYTFELTALQAVTRYSGRLSLALFSILFIGLPDRQKVSGILSDKPFHVFALAHGIHLVQLLSYVYLSGNELIPIRLAGGFLAYVLVFIMPVLDQRRNNRALPESRFGIWLTIYLYYVWFIFFMSYLPRVQGKLPNVGGQYWEFVALLAWVCILLGMKLTRLLLQRSQVRQ